MKKTLKLIMSLCIIGLTCSGLRAETISATIGDLKYSLNTETREAECTDRTDGNITTIIVPGTVSYQDNQYDVIKLHPRSSWSNLTYLEVKEGVKELWGPITANTMKLPSSLEKCIGVLSATENLYFPTIQDYFEITYDKYESNPYRSSGLTFYIDEEPYTFEDDYVIPEGIKVVKSYTLNYLITPNFSSITFPEGVTTIEDGAINFWESNTGCTFNLPQSIESFGTLQLPVFSVSKYIFNFPSEIKIYEVGAGGYTFASQLQINGQEYTFDKQNVVIPDGVTKVPNYFTRDYYSLIQSIKLPEGLLSIGIEAFAGCSVSSIEFPESLETIGDNAFQGCSQLKNIELPKNLKSIGGMAFHGININTITLPESITHIGGYAFMNFEIDEFQVYCYIKDPGVASNLPFDFKNTIVYVPSGSLAEYQSSKVWNEYYDLRGFIDEVDGSFSVNDFEINANETLTVPVNLDVDLLNNPVSGIQFDLTLPEKISLSEIKLSEELNNASFTIQYQNKGNNLTRVIIYQSSNTKPEGIRTLGHVLDLTLKAATDINSGVKQMVISNSMISTTTAEDILLSGITVQVTVNSTINSIKITPQVKNIEVGESFDFTAIIEPVDARNKNLIWTVDRNDVAKISGNALNATVTGLSLGSVTVTATSPYDNSIMGTATLNVVGHIIITGDKNVIKETEELELTASFSVVGMDSPAIVWSSSDPATATVDAQSGLVTGIKAGEVTITASARDYEGISTTYEITVEPRILGDANDNGYVNVSDVVAIANYIVDYTVRNFCFVNADADNNKDVTANDITTTVNIILDDDDYSVGPRSVRAYAMSSTDFLSASNFEAATGRELNIGVNLDNSIDYVALQASLVVPEGMRVKDVKAGSRAANHSLMFNIKDDGTVKIVLFSLSNIPFAGVDEPLFTIVAVASEDCGNLDFANILASDRDNNEYALGFTGGLNESFTTGIGNVEAAGGDVRYYTIDGVEIKNPSAGQLVIRVQDGNVEKVIVK